MALGDPQPAIDAMKRWAQRPDGALIALCIRLEPASTAGIDLCFDDETPIVAMLHAGTALLAVAHGALEAMGAEGATIVLDALQLLQRAPAVVTNVTPARGRHDG